MRVPQWCALPIKVGQEQRHVTEIRAAGEVEEFGNAPAEQARQPFEGGTSRLGWPRMQRDPLTRGKADDARCWLLPMRNNTEDLARAAEIEPLAIR